MVSIESLRSFRLTERQPDRNRFMPAAIRAVNLLKSYPAKPPVEAVRGIDLEVMEGECFGLLGPNGAGKTTTMEMLEGLLEPTSGTIEILGYRWGNDDAVIRCLIGISLQETRLMDRQTVRETIDLFRSFYPHPIATSEAIAAVSLEEKSNAYVEKLSGGQLQRLAIATAIVGDPKLLFLDEPTTGLDPQSRRQLWDVIRAFQSRGRTILLTTHYMDEAERLCDRVAVVDHGKIMAIGTPSELIRKFGGEHVVEFDIAGDGPPLDLESLNRLNGVEQSRITEEGYVLVVREPHVAISSLFEYLESNRLALTHLTTRQSTLEDVFIALTGRHLREDQPNVSSKVKA
jgi:ABC-2 type transport system ATP-binding protein